ncbi:hypothetical protein, partial [Acidiplasma aeolicum]|uniref:hypothetical protein n=1 Tax=Acidiplasma aeolicum TaxID=507754 RepID=UPI00371563DE
MPKFLLYLPYSEFFDYYTYKALGEIPLAFKNIGYESEIIVGQMKSELYKKLNVKIFETGYLDTEFIVDQRQKHKLKYRIKNLLDFRELKKVLRILKQEKPDLIMSYNNSTLTPLIFIIYRISILFHGYKPRIVLKLDNDGSDLSGLKG